MRSWGLSSPAPLIFRETDEPVLVFEEERFHRLVANPLLHCAEVGFGAFSNSCTVALVTGPLVGKRTVLTPQQLNQPFGGQFTA